MAEKMTVVDNLAGGLVMAGGLQIGAMEFFNYDIVGTILPSYAHWVYKAIGIATVYFAYKLYTIYRRK